ncbi:hypothetical protein ACJ6WF_17165 [Streptomyces sp. MMS24-I2-30]|uniref:hypothetical protein n=1 Tax=Streptomyces sp. MMS24-I2-30 TaxID=3351564 RepID=UPI003896A9C5
MTDQTNPAPADLRQRIAEALMRWAEGGNDPKYATLRRPETVTRNAYGRADAVLAELRPELDRLGDYENRINWGTSCGSCGHVLDSSIRETDRAEKAEAAVARVQNLGNVWLDAPDPLARAMAADLISCIRGPQRPAPAHDAGPTIAEAAANDARWWGGEKTGE